MSESSKARRSSRSKGDVRPPKREADGPSADAQGYVALVAELKQRIADARLRAALSVNRELVLLYWGIGRDILSRQESEGWGAKVIDRLAVDLGRSFPEKAATSSSIRSRAAYSSDKAALLRISPGRCPPASPNSPNRFSKIPTASISFRLGSDAHLVKPTFFDASKAAEPPRLLGSPRQGSEIRSDDWPWNSEYVSQIHFVARFHQMCVRAHL